MFHKSNEHINIWVSWYILEDSGFLQKLIEGDMLATTAFYYLWKGLDPK